MRCMSFYILMQTYVHLQQETMNRAKTMDYISWHKLNDALTINDALYGHGKIRRKQEKINNSPGSIHFFSFGML